MKNKIKFQSLFSGSRGNCHYLNINGSEILIDCGSSFKKICDNLNAIGADFRNIKKVFITHEHSDHINALNTLCNKIDAKIYGNEKTIIRIKEKFPKILDSRFEYIEDSCVEFDDFKITAFRTPHDSVCSQGYYVENENKKFTVATDIGEITGEIREILLDSNGIFLESNHDENMLLANTSYPYYLKRRILSNKGHLSNNSCSEMVSMLCQSSCEYIMLGHLSEKNNFKELALSCSEKALEKSKTKNIKLTVSEFLCPSGEIIL